MLRLKPIDGDGGDWWWWGWREKGARGGGGGDAEEAADEAEVHEGDGETAAAARNW